ncbi:unnamed protein product [Rhizophagus irregularis]|nr:unnamed protein product [Rhizophagus irregularis]
MMNISPMYNDLRSPTNYQKIAKFDVILKAIITIDRCIRLKAIFELLVKTRFVSSFKIKESFEVELH